MNIWGPIDGSWSHHDHVRHFMYESIFRALQLLTWPERDLDVVEFGALLPTTSVIRMLGHLRGEERIRATMANYPEYDIQRTAFPDESFQVAIADQVLEHVEKPWLAAEELYRILRVGGVAVITTPFLYPIHESPLDCWRIAPDGYRVLFPPEKWETRVLDQWGWKDLLISELTSPVVRGFQGAFLSVEQAKRLLPNYYHPLSDSRYPIVIWWVGVKR